MQTSPAFSAADLHRIFDQADEHVPDYQSFGERSELLARVAEEMEAQDQKWGEQTHPFVLSPYSSHRQSVGMVTRERYEDLANQYKAINDARVADDCQAWDGIFLEEVYEALAEDEPEHAITELVQCAAVALQAAVSIARNGVSGRR